ncbi:unnamed protein product, partial [Allacma fusca]
KDKSRKLQQRWRILSITEQSPRWFAREFHRLQIIHGFYNKLWSTSNACVEVVTLAASSLTFYLAVRLSGARSAHQLIVAAFATSFLINIWENMGQTYEISSEVLQSWTVMKGSTLWFKKYLRSVKPIRVIIGTFFYADRQIKLTIFSIILNQTLSLLLSISH